MKSLKNFESLKESSTKSIHALLSKDQKDKFSHYILGLLGVHISLSDENIKIIEI